MRGTDNVTKTRMHDSGEGRALDCWCLSLLSLKAERIAIALLNSALASQALRLTQKAQGACAGHRVRQSLLLFAPWNLGN